MTFAEIVAAYGKDAKQRLSGPGEREALLVTPVTRLIEQAASLIHRQAVAHNEVAELAGSVRPDFGVRVDGILIGHIELKAPGTSLDPSSYGATTHNYRQWQRLKELPNLLHTNGTEFRLWRYGELVDTPVHLHTADLSNHSGTLTAPGRLELVLNAFLEWSPTPITSVARLVDTLAPLARLLREEVHDALRAERRAMSNNADSAVMPFTGIKADWRRLLFPQATDAEFSDGFAQTVVFALLLALSEGIDLEHLSLHDIAKQLESHHTLMGRSLNLLTEHVEDTPTWTAIEIIVRVLSATNWAGLGSSGDNLYLHLYEHFLAAYDPEKRRASGSYYTPVPVVDSMVRLTDTALKQFMARPEGLRNPHVSIVDPAMGTGTYPLSILRHAGAAAAKQFGPGAAPEAVSNVVNRLYGIEIQSGPFSVAELRITAAIKDHGAPVPPNGLNLFVADTLEDPYSASKEQLSYTLQLIAKQRQQANAMKRDKNIQVCIGNPPYADHAGGLGGWIESGIDPETGEHPLNAFRLDGNGKHERHLSNLYSYFWRWATWKVFESTNQPDVKGGGNGVISFITATGYLAGPGFKGMRQYLRRTCSRGWIINVTPEGKQPPSANAVFNIETPVAIGIFLRQDGTDPQSPAQIRYIDIHGKRQDKFDALGGLTFDDPGWRDVRSEWTAPFTPAVSGEWDDYPAVDDIFPWRAPGIMAGRGWVYAPSPGLLELRFRELVNEDDKQLKAKKLVVSAPVTLDFKKAPLPGSDTTQNTQTSISNLTMATEVQTVRCAFRALDRQWVLPDSRLLNRPSPTLWQGRIPGQVFAAELHSEYPKAGPGLVFTNLIPDVHHFRGSGGGRVLPMLHPDGSSNVAAGLLDVLSRELGQPVQGEDLFAYVAGVAGHSGYVAEFDDELRTPGVRIPLTKDAALWEKGVKFGLHLIWLQTFGETGAHPDGCIAVREANLPVPHPTYAVSVSGMPEDWSYDRVGRQLHVGKGRWDDVMPEVLEYTVGGTSVLESWLDYRMRKPKKRYRSPLDHITATQWDPNWSTEMSELLSTLTQLVLLEEEMNDLLSDVLAAPVFSRSELAHEGTSWPKGDMDRRPRKVATDTLFDD